MGIGRFFKSLVNKEVMGEEIIASQEKVYAMYKLRYPSAEPHALLTQAWLTRMAARGKIPNINFLEADEMIMSAFSETITLAISETMLFACTPPLNNVRALGLYFIYKERPDIPKAYPKFVYELEAIMSPVFTAIAESGSFDALYQRYNPKMASEMAIKQISEQVSEQVINSLRDEFGYI